MDKTGEILTQFVTTWISFGQQVKSGILRAGVLVGVAVSLYGGLALIGKMAGWW